MTNSRNPIPKRLKEARSYVGISQKKLGIRAGIDEFSASARMNQYETGKHIPDFLTLKRIGKVLGYPVAYFYADDDALAEIIIMFHELNPGKKKKAIEALQALLE